MRYLAFEIGLRGMSPRSLKTVYLAAVSSYFVGKGVRNGFAEAQKSAVVRYVLRGYLKIYSLMHPAGEAKKLAFTVELVKYLKIVLTPEQRKREGGVYAWALDLALKFGIYFLLRKSEFLPGSRLLSGSGAQGVGMRFKVIRFYREDGGIVEWKKVGVGCAKSVEILVPRSKTDQYGYGRFVRHNRVAGDNCIVKELER